MNSQNHSLFQSVKFAVNGIKIATRYNRNIRIHFLIAISVLISCFVLEMKLVEIAVISMIILLVISAEMINTAIEEVIDLITKDYREEAKFAKDVSAGMVLIVAIGSIAIGLLIFTPYILRLFSLD